VKLIVLVALVLYVGYLHGASSEKIGQDCKRLSDWSGDVYDQIKANETVTLTGVYAEDAARFEFIRDWVKKGKSREDLVAYVFNHCRFEEA
jgi:hypothetical protein